MTLAAQSSPASMGQGLQGTGALNNGWIIADAIEARLDTAWYALKSEGLGIDRVIDHEIAGNQGALNPRQRRILEERPVPKSLLLRTVGPYAETLLAKATETTRPVLYDATARLSAEQMLSNVNKDPGPLSDAYSKLVEQTFPHLEETLRHHAATPRVALFVSSCVEDYLRDQIIDNMPDRDSAGSTTLEMRLLSSITGLRSRLPDQSQALSDLTRFIAYDGLCDFDGLDITLISYHPVFEGDSAILAVARPELRALAIVRNVRKLLTRSGATEREWDLLRSPEHISRFGTGFADRVHGDNLLQEAIIRSYLSLPHALKIAVLDTLARMIAPLINKDNIEMFLQLLLIPSFFVNNRGVRMAAIACLESLLKKMPPASKKQVANLLLNEFKKDPMAGQPKAYLHLARAIDCVVQSLGMSQTADYIISDFARAIGVDHPPLNPDVVTTVVQADHRTWQCFLTIFTFMLRVASFNTLLCSFERLHPDDQPLFPVIRRLRPLVMNPLLDLTYGLTQLDHWTLLYTWIRMHNVKEDTEIPTGYYDSLVNDLDALIGRTQNSEYAETAIRLTRDILTRRLKIEKDAQTRKELTTAISRVDRISRRNRRDLVTRQIPPRLESPLPALAEKP